MWKYSNCTSKAINVALTARRGLRSNIELFSEKAHQSWAFMICVKKKTFFFDVKSSFKCWKPKHEPEVRCISSNPVSTAQASGAQGSRMRYRKQGWRLLLQNVDRGSHNWDWNYSVPCMFHKHNQELLCPPPQNSFLQQTFTGNIGGKDQFGDIWCCDT